MPEEKVTALRIPQAAKEYNVSQDRIVDILTKHGFEIKTQNAKLSAEMQQCLQKELAKDKMVKEKSDQILPPKNKKEEAKTATTEKAHEEESDSQHVIIHSTGIGVKSVGKIDLEALKPTKSKAKKEAEPASEPEKVDETPQETPANLQETPATEPQTELETEQAEESFDEDVEKPDHIETVTHITGPEIIGKMDLEALKPKKKTATKEKKSQKKEKQPAKSAKPAAETPKQEEPVQEEEPAVARIFTVTGTCAALTSALTISPKSFGSFMRALPAPLPATFGTGQPALKSMTYRLHGDRACA